MSSTSIGRYLIVFNPSRYLNEKIKLPTTALVVKEIQERLLSPEIFKKIK